jgi:hypothetical protein
MSKLGLYRRMMERYMMSLATSKRNSVLKLSMLKVCRLFLVLDVLDGKLSRAAWYSSRHTFISLYFRLL